MSFETEKFINLINNKIISHIESLKKGINNLSENRKVEIIIELSEKEINNYLNEVTEEKDEELKKCWIPKVTSPSDKECNIIDDIKLKEAIDNFEHQFELYDNGFSEYEIIIKNNKYPPLLLNEIKRIYQEAGWKYVNWVYQNPTQENIVLFLSVNE